MKRWNRWLAVLLVVCTLASGLPMTAMAAEPPGLVLTGGPETQPENQPETQPENQPETQPENQPETQRSEEHTSELQSP